MSGGGGGILSSEAQGDPQNITVPNLHVLKLGCGEGHLLAVLNPCRGVGIDFSREMVLRATRRHSHLAFIQTDAHAFAVHHKFDVIILSDLLNEAWDVLWKTSR